MWDMRVPFCVGSEDSQVQVRRAQIRRCATQRLLHLTMRRARRSHNTLVRTVDRHAAISAS